MLEENLLLLLSSQIYNHSFNLRNQFTISHQNETETQLEDIETSIIGYYEVEGVVIERKGNSTLDEYDLKSNSNAIIYKLKENEDQSKKESEITKEAKNGERRENDSPEDIKIKQEIEKLEREKLLKNEKIRNIIMKKLRKDLEKLFIHSQTQATQREKLDSYLKKEICSGLDIESTKLNIDPALLKDPKYKAQIEKDLSIHTGTNTPSNTPSNTLSPEPHQITSNSSSAYRKEASVNEGNESKLHDFEAYFQNELSQIDLYQYVQDNLPYLYQNFIRISPSLYVYKQKYNQNHPFIKNWLAIGLAAFFRNKVCFKRINRLRNRKYGASLDAGKILVFDVKIKSKVYLKIMTPQNEFYQNQQEQDEGEDLSQEKESLYDLSFQENEYGAPNYTQTHVFRFETYEKAAQDLNKNKFIICDIDYALQGNPHAKAKRFIS